GTSLASESVVDGGHSASYRSPPRGQKSQHSEHPVHILTSSGRPLSLLTPIEFDGHTATQVPHWMQRSAKITPASSSQNQVLPGGSVTPFISSRMRKPFIGFPPGRDPSRALPAWPPAPRWGRGGPNCGRALRRDARTGSDGRSAVERRGRHRQVGRSRSSR